MEMNALVEALLGSQLEFDGDDEYWFPASHSQSALWFICDSNPDNLAYNIPIAYRVRGAFDVGIMARSIETVVLRHDTFRTTFVEQDGEVKQVVREARAYTTPVVRVSDAGGDLQETLIGLLDAWLGYHFDLARGPLVKTAIVHVSDDEHYLLFALHHTIVDHLSIMKMRDEMALVYESLKAGRPVSLPELEFQYPDYAVWQIEEKTQLKLSDRLGTWTDAITAPPGCINLPVDRERPRVQSFSGSEVRAEIEPGLAQRARDFAKARGVSPFVALLSVYYVLLYRYSRQEQILVGVPFANRTESDLEEVIGLFINTLPLPMTLGDDMSYADVVDATRRIAIRVQGNQDVPLGFIVEETHPVREPSYNPMFQVGFTVQDPPVVMTLAGLEIEDLELHSGGSMYDLHTWLWDKPDGSMGFQVWYDDAVFEESTVLRFMEHYRRVLDAALSAPEASVGSISFVTQEELAQFEAWNNTDQPIEEPVLMPACLFHRDRNWDHPAVTCDGVTYTHAGLRALTTQVSNYLYGQGVRAGDRVGVLMERRADMFPVLMGIMQLGAAYVPLDPEYPVDRILYIIEDASVQVICVHADTRSMIEAAAGTLLEIDTQWDAIAAMPDSPDFPPHDDPEAVAYIIHTSGSTGRPKGVLVPNRAVSNLLRAVARDPGFGPEDIQVAVTTTCFDTSIMDLYLQTMVGGTTVFANRDTVVDGKALRELIEGSGATIMQATPTSWRLLIQAGWRGSDTFRGICTGEPLPADLCRELFPCCGGGLWNLYGPTEATVWCTGMRIEDPDAKIMIGRAVDNDRAYILNEQRQLQPLGVHGELYIGGVGVTLGYLDRPELTAEKFVPDPFHPSGGLMYATGDLVRWTKEGIIEHLGRIDTQVKVRGFRIELGEIEAAINEISTDVLQSVATTWSPTPGDVRIVAYLKTASGQPPATGAIRKGLRQRLPNYMIPQHFVSIDEIPQTGSGKVDRKALPEPDIAGQTGPTVVAPATETEAFLVELWKQILSAPHVSTHENFFTMGGQSLMAVQMIGEIEKKYGVRLKPRTVILETLAGIGAMLDSGAGEELEPEAVPVTPRKGILSRLFGR